MKRALVILVIGAAAAAGVAPAAVPANRRQALSDAQSIIGGLRLPDGAKQSASDPSGGALGHPGMYPATPNLVDLHQFWTVPRDPRSVYQWLTAHPPARSKVTFTSISVRDGTPYARTVGFSFHGFVGGPSSSTLVEEVVAERGGASAVRADVEVVWLFVRPRSERVPRGVDLVRIAQWRSSTTVRDPRRVKRIVALVDRLPAAQPGAVACPLDAGPHVRVSFFRRRSSKPLAVAVADGSGCGLVAFLVHGHRASPLAGGPRLIRSLRSLGLPIT